MVAQTVKNFSAIQGDLDSIPRFGKIPRKGHGYPLPVFLSTELMDRVAWWATYSPWDRKD